MYSSCTLCPTIEGGSDTVVQLLLFIVQRTCTTVGILPFMCWKLEDTKCASRKINRYTHEHIDNRDNVQQIVE